MSPIKRGEYLVVHAVIADQVVSLNHAPNRLAIALVAVGRSDPLAFRELHRLTSRKLFGICERICGNSHDAEDVLHDVYLSIWRRAADWDAEMGTSIAWLSAIARNRSIDWLRKNRRFASLPDERVAQIPDPARNAEALLLQADLYRHLHQCLAEIDETKRDVIRASFLHGATYAELAESRGVPIGTMKSWVRRGLKTMKASLDEIYRDQPEDRDEARRFALRSTRESRSTE